jgi:membrane protease YdiL (CAAX protease family)
MKTYKHFAVNRPFLFGLSLVVLFSLLSTLTFPLTMPFPNSPRGGELGSGLAKLAVFLCFLFLLWKFGWLERAGFTRLGDWRGWLVMIPFLVYSIFVTVYAFTGDLRLEFPRELADTSAVTGNYLIGSLLEETIYRGLVLVAMVLAWGQTRKGLFKAAFFSAFLFSMLHFFNLMINPFLPTLIQAIGLTIPGFFYAAIVLKYKSIWPVVVFHWLTNLGLNLKVFGHLGFAATPEMWIWYLVLKLPLAIYAAYLLWNLPVEDTSNEITLEELGPAEAA